jgi:hypothetical protein
VKKAVLREYLKNRETLKNEKTGKNEEKKPRFSLKKGKKGDK